MKSRLRDGSPAAVRSACLGAGAFAALSVVGLTVLAGCGGSGGGSDTASPTPTPTATATPTPTPTTSASPGGDAVTVQ